MNNEEISKKEEIESALAAMIDDDFLETSKDLLAALGYCSDRTANFPGTADDFIRRFPARNENTDTEQEFLNNVESVELVFQVSSEEIAPNDQPMLFEAPTFDEGYVRTFTFFAIELTDNDYPRGKYAQFTREVNKRMVMPIVVFFRVKDRLTIGFVGRRQHRRDPDRDVLEQVTLIKDIRLDNPHRAHTEVLFELSLEECAKWMSDHKEQENFEGLLAAWLARLDTEELNKKFYRELFNWFEWAVAEGKFPTDKNRTVDPEEHVIRLITRLLFVWFIKEKGLVADELFNETQISPLLKDYDREPGDSYYRTVLQNLFFATLNTEIGKRGFSPRTNAKHRDFSRYRYEDQITDPTKLRSLFDQTPFINGGLFDCLDSEEATRDGGYRIDCFSDVDYDKLRVPNRLFFDKDHGLIPLLEHYKFTVEENTPIEQEVALDPELLGKVFENLLAAYNPETGTTARKQTGSYYTPRVIVDYMVEEALVAALAEQVQPTNGDTELWEEELRYLFNYAKVCDDASEWFNDDEIDKIVRAISELKILDPAVGSGAFPMSVLHKLTLALRRLDPDNTLWEQLQQDRAGKRAQAAFKISNQQTRESELVEISDTFERYRDSDFGRKLYLIQNSIFGVDIQSIACSIAKLRFFISLAIEQEPTQEVDNNFGIKPLPNLETRFIAANTLIGLQLSETRLLLQEDAIQQLIKEIEGIREKRFLTNDRGQKLKLEEREDECRKQLKEELESQREKWVENQQREIERKVAQLPNPEHRKQLREVEEKEYDGRKKKFDFSFEDARKIASWKSYDQNASADWFDPEWMFGVRTGFDVVIGNPPYISHDKIPEKLKTEIRNHYQSYEPFADVYCYFIEKAIGLQNKQGILSFITSNSYLRAEYGAPIRKLLKNENMLLRVLNIEDSQVFESVIVNVAIIVSRKSTNLTDDFCIVVNSPFSGNSFEDFIKNNGFHYPQTYFNSRSWNLVEPKFVELQKKLESSGKTLEQLMTKIRLGIATGSNEAFLIDEDKKREFCERNPVNAEIIKPILRGRDISRYSYTSVGQYILLAKNGVNVQRDYPDIYEHLESFGDRFRNRGAQGQHWTNLRACSFYDDFKKEKIVWIELTDSGRFALCNEEIYLLNSAYFLLPPSGIESKFLLGVLNSSTIRFYLNLIAETSGMGTSRWINNYVKAFPIPEATCEQQALIIGLVDQILDAKHTDPDADVSDLEKRIDRIVYLLYDLTPEEIAIVEAAENV